jgi:hypothetical protein
MASVPGIEAICKWQWFGGRYEQDKGGFFAQFGIDPETFLPSYPEMKITKGSYDDFKKQMEKMFRVKYSKKDMLGKTNGPSMRVNAMHITFEEDHFNGNNLSVGDT